MVYEYANFKVDYETRTQRFNEIVDIILGLWSTPGFTYHGEHYQVDDLTIVPTPIQKPHPPMYQAVSRTPGTIDDAVSRGLPMLTSANTPDEDVLGLRDLYATGCAEAGVEPQWEDMPFLPGYLRCGRPENGGEEPSAGHGLGGRPKRVPPHAQGRQRDLRRPGQLAKEQARRPAQL